jgi:tRNA threonylcarbamoyladenosine biosynthesis protein TsaE
MTQIIHLPAAAATHRLGQRLGQVLPIGTVLLLYGDLGAGKTSLVQGLGQGLGIQDAIDSPTFTLINEYHDGQMPLYHLDLYRLSPAEVLSLNLEGYWDGIETAPGLVAIEWPERLSCLPDRYVEVRLSLVDEGRQAEIAAIGLNLNPLDQTVLGD